MTVMPERRRAVFENLNRQLGRLAKHPAPQSVHKVRTYGRRLEAFLGELNLEPTRNDKKLIKALARLRRKAGRVRDLDVQMGTLSNLKVPGSGAQKSQLMARLSEERDACAQKLARSFDRQKIEKLRKRVRRSAKEAHVSADCDPVKVATQLVLSVDKNGVPFTEKTLHQYRIAGKRARYVAELAGEDPEALRLVRQLKAMQDVIGDWHDWLKLTARAEELFGGASDSVLVAALRNITRAKFRAAVDALSEARAGLRLGASFAHKSPSRVRESAAAA
jgi:CHAD domain-containing protein